MSSTTMIQNLKQIRRAAICLVLLASLAGTATDSAAEELRLRAMTFNLRYASPTGPNSWPDRRPVVRDAILQHSPDLIGTQEGLYHQLREIESDLAEFNYRWIGEGREGGSAGEFMAVFYNTTLFEPVDYSHMWLSDTPRVIGSNSWGNNLPRMVTRVRFRHKATGFEFHFWNTHFDHQSQPSRERSAEFLIEQVRAARPTLPTIVTGDFNQSQEDIVHQTMVANVETAVNLYDTWELARNHVGRQIGTWNGWKGENESDRRIDWILMSQPFTALSSQVVTYQKNGQYPSDHFPVLSVLSVEVPPAGTEAVPAEIAENQK